MAKQTYQETLEDWDVEFKVNLNGQYSAKELRQIADMAEIEQVKAMKEVASALNPGVQCDG